MGDQDVCHFRLHTDLFGDQTSGFQQDDTATHTKGMALAVAKALFQLQAI